MRDVARVAGVGLKTVSRVVNEEGGVSEELRERVSRAVHELGYLRNEMASDLRAGRSSATIGLITEDLGNPFYSAVARGVEQVVGPRGLGLITASSEEDEARERQIIADLRRRRVVGLIVVPAGTDHHFLAQEIDSGRHVIFLDRPAAGVECDTVLLDNRGGSAAATEHLLKRGHRRIAIIGHDSRVWTMRERLAGFTSAIDRSGGTVAPELVRFGPVTPADAAQVTAELLDLTHPPTAFFGCNNRMTVGILSECRRRGVSIDVAGFDDIETAALFEAPLTLVSYDVNELGQIAARLLLERLDGRQTMQQVVVGTRLVSYGPPGLRRRTRSGQTGAR